MYDDDSYIVELFINNHKLAVKSMRAHSITEREIPL